MPLKSGDLIVLCRNNEKGELVKLEKDGRTDLKEGTIFHNTIINNELYTIVTPHKKRFPNILIHPYTPSQYCRSLELKTQVLFEPDLAFISALLGLKLGSVVLEAGTGSLCSAVTFSRIVGNTGKVYTFEQNEERYLNALKVLQTLDCPNIHVTHRDVYKDGLNPFIGEDVNFLSDAIFLDLPDPSQAFSSVVKLLKPTCPLVVFIPSTDQLVMATEELYMYGFIDVKAYEIMCRSFWIFYDRENYNGNSTITKPLQSSDEDCSKQMRLTRDMLNAQTDNSLQLDLDNFLFKTPNYSVAPAKTRGHTGYLIFATKPVEHNTNIRSVTELSKTIVY